MAWPLLFLLISVSAIGPLTLNGVLPATSAVMSDLATRYETAQLVLTVFLLANLVSQIVFGPAADRYGRRPVLIMSLVVFVIGSLMCALAQSIEWLLIGRFVQGVGAAVCVFLPRTIVRDVYSQDRSASVIGYMTTAMMVAPLFGPAMGGWITDQVHRRFMYVGLASLGALLCLAAWRYQSETLAALVENRMAISETLLERNAVQRKQLSPLTLFKEPGFIACTCILAGAVGVYYGFLSGAPFVAMESRGLSASEYGRWFVLVAVGYLTGNLTAGRFSERIGVERMVTLGFFPFCAGIVLFWLLMSVGHPAGLFFPMMLVAFSNGVSLPSIFSIAMSVRPELSASASGVAGSVQTLFGVILSLAMGYLLPISDIWMYVLLSTSAVVSLVGLILTLRLKAA